MVKYTHYFIAAFIMLIAVSHCSFAQKVMNIPSEYLMPMDEKSKSMGVPLEISSGEFWLCYSDRGENVTYSDQACTSPTGKSLRFMQPIYILQETAKAVQFVEYDYADEYGELMDGYKLHSGWLPKETVLLWSSCLKTRDTNLPGFEGGIFNKKAIILNIKKGNQTDYVSPNFYSSPNCRTNEVVDEALVYQINFIYKETDDAYLVAEIPTIMNIRKDLMMIKGWVRKSQTTSWNHRLAYEINWEEDAVSERKSKGFRAQVYSSNSKATQTKSGSSGILGDVFSEKGSTYEQRTIGELDRFPVLNFDNGIANVGVIGDLTSKGGQNLSAQDFASLRHVIDSLARTKRNVNLMFVVDATSSVIPYSQAIQRAVTSTMRSLSRESKNKFHFGVLLYRDGTEKYEISSSRDLSVNYRQVSSTLNKYMTASYNRCNEDEEECMFYGMERAIRRFDPPKNETNIMIHIGDAGSHSRSEYTDCNGVTKADKTNISIDEVSELMASKNVHLLSFQVRNLEGTQACELFQTQVKQLMNDVSEKRGEQNANFSVNSEGIYAADQTSILSSAYFSKSGTAFTPNDFSNKLSENLLYIDDWLNRDVDRISQFLNNKIDSKTLSQNSDIVKTLKEAGITDREIEILIQKSGQMFNTGYAPRLVQGLNHPIYQDVLLMSHEDIYNIKRALELLIPTDEYSKSESEYRAYLVYNWRNILVNILGYFPEHSEAIDDLNLSELSAILTGWEGKEKFKHVLLKDIVEPEKFPSELLYEYLVDWCITKGHIQSIYDGQNVLTQSFFESHMYSVFYAFIYNKSGKTVEEDPQVISSLSRYYSKYDHEYESHASEFSIPVGTGTGMKYFWVDARIFPHNISALGAEDQLKSIFEKY